MRARVKASTAGAASSSIAQADASSIAADDDRPALGGRVEAMTPRRPVSGRPASVERPGGARDVVDPAAGLRARPVQVEAVALAGVEPGQLDPAVVGRQVGDADLEVDGGGQDEALVVVGVLADEVDPAGRADDDDVVGGGSRWTARRRTSASTSSSRPWEAVIGSCPGRQPRSPRAGSPPAWRGPAGRSGRRVPPPRTRRTRCPSRAPRGGPCRRAARR